MDSKANSIELVTTEWQKNYPEFRETKKYTKWKRTSEKRLGG